MTSQEKLDTRVRQRVRVSVTVPPQGPADSMDAATATLIQALLAGVQRAVVEAGAIPVPLSLGPDTADTSELELGDALILVGGGDVHPNSYGQSPSKANYAMSRPQDEFETALLRRALAEDIPVLAICRGMQLLNVALGGTLVQHLPDPQALHRGQSADGLMVQHDVLIHADSMLARALHHGQIAVSSGHHQAVGILGHELRPVATAADGVIEAIELPHGWVLGVQWHPEHELSDPDDRARLFGCLVAAAAARSGDADSHLQSPR